MKQTKTSKLALENRQLKLENEQLKKQIEELKAKLSLAEMEKVTYMNYSLTGGI